MTVEETASDRKVPIRKVAIALLAMAVTIGGIGVTEAAALWRRLGSNQYTADVSIVDVCRDGVVADVVVRVDDDPHAIDGNLFYDIAIAETYTPRGLAASHVASRPLVGSDPQFRYVAEAGLPQDWLDEKQVTDPDTSPIRYYSGRFVVPFPQLQAVDTVLYLDNPQDFGDTYPVPLEDEEMPPVRNCRTWGHSFGSFFAQLFNLIARAFNIDHQGTDVIPVFLD